jgi:hypothetical protein
MSSGSVPPDSFLGGSAPRLRTLYLCGIPFQGLPKLLLSATHLVHLWLTNISPYYGYMSPEAMATSLSMLTSLEELIFQFQFQPRQSFPDVESRCPPLPTRSVLPVFTRFSFEGVNEYLEDLVSQIDAPQLYRLSTKLFHGVDFKCPELNRFISRMPTLEAYDEACLIFLKNEALVRLRQHPDRRSDHGMVEVKLFEVGQWPEWQLSSLAQICTFPLRLLLTMENLYIYENPLSPHYWSDDIQNTEWLDLLLPFTAVKNLHLSEKISPHIAPALKELTQGRRTEVLPALQNVLLEGFRPSKPVQKGIARFISARQLTNHPVAISAWNRDYLYMQ